ncbi:MAG: laccase domain-containing protein [Acidimicrobiia bacterium]|nr:laccase domain-containing protein [Acidimicrobiia bacterium]
MNPSGSRPTRSSPPRRTSCSPSTRRTRAPIVLVAEEGVVATIHAGWRGLLAGIVTAGVRAVRTAGGRTITAVLGPCIHRECYEFGPADLQRLEGRLGATVRASTAAGRPALDLPAAVRAALVAEGIDRLEDVDRCTGCDPSFHSHRVRGDTGRQATLAWISGP